MTKVIAMKNAPSDWKSNPDFVYIGRGSVAGNPFRIGDKHPDTGQPMTRDDVCDLYEERTLPWLIERVPQYLSHIKGKTLVCFCHPQRCHGHILAKAANEA